MYILRQQLASCISHDLSIVSGYMHVDASTNNEYSMVLFCFFLGGDQKNVVPKT